MLYIQSMQTPEGTHESAYLCQVILKIVKV